MLTVMHFIISRDPAAYYRWQAHYVYLESGRRTRRLSSSSINFEAGEARELEELLNELQVWPTFVHGLNAIASLQVHHAGIALDLVVRTDLL